jgi:hypothetical protein
VAAGALDVELCGLLWLLSERAVPLVAAATDIGHGALLRGAIAALLEDVAGTDDGPLPGGTVRGGSLEDVLRVGGASTAPAGTGDVGDESRDLGVVCVVRPSDAAAPFVVATAHYVRPVERDAAGHLQRRPPAILAAWDERARHFDHFFWAITDELATRAGLEPPEFDDAHRRRVALLRDLVDAQVFDEEHVRRHIERAALVEAHMGAIRTNAPN